MSNQEVAAVRRAAAQREFEALSRKLVAGGSDVDAISESLRRHQPQLVRQIQRDAGRPGMLQLWGESRNVDENTGTEIVPPPILAALSALADVPLQLPQAHAGVAHTYGYLFSLIETPYGRKSDRWFEGQIAATLGVPAHLLSHQPRNGTLLANTTYAFGRIAFRGRRRQVGVLRTFQQVAARPLREFAYPQLRGHRIVETLMRGRRRISLCTELIRSPKSRTESRLLVYWWLDNVGHARLITGFPVTEAAAHDMIDGAAFGNRVEIRVRFNGCVPLFSQSGPRTLKGSRALYERGARMRRLA